MKSHLFLCALGVACTGSAIAQSDASGHIAGLRPYQRPDGAPQLTEADRTPAQLEYALRGIEKPIPGNVESIAATGNWWVPLRQPGMDGAYDLRNWHNTAAEADHGNLRFAPAAPKH